MKNFKDFLVVNKLLNLKKVQANLKALTTLKSLQSFQSKYQDIEEQHKAEKEDKDIITPTLTIKKLP